MNDKKATAARIAPGNINDVISITTRKYFQRALDCAIENRTDSIIIGQIHFIFDFAAGIVKTRRGSRGAYRKHFFTFND